jgi:tetratricopeptide (TPR) repeat protein
VPLLSLSATEALERLKAPDARWPDGRRDGRRLEGIVLPGVTPGFQLRPGEMILTMGSCFARNIEVRLKELGFRVPALELQLPADERGSDTANDLLNKYNPHSMANELRWAFEEPFPDEAYLKIGPGEWHDPHLAGNVRAAPLSRLRARRALVTRLFKRLPRCRALVVTLGLVEAWHDATTGLYLNTAPPAAAIAREPKRFRFDVLGHDEVLAELERLWALVQAHGHRRARMLLTVSPVPLRATYTGGDVLVANGYSKSMLRAAAGAFAAAHKEVDYFPSYEAATLTARPIAFQEDNRHVAPELVHAILDRVMEGYGPPAPEGPAPPPAEPDEAEAALSLRGKLRNHLKMGRPAEALAILAKLEPAGRFTQVEQDEFGFRFTYARVLAETGALLDATVQLDRCLLLRPDSALAHMALGRLLARLQRPIRAQEAFARAVELDPGSVDGRVRLARMQLRLGRPAEAEATALAAQALASDSADVAELLTEIGVADARHWGDGPGSDEAASGRVRLRDRVAAFLHPPCHPTGP